MPAYTARDGTRIDLPDNAPPSDPIPVFRTEDLPWIADAISRAEADLARTEADAARAPGVFDDRVAAGRALRELRVAKFGSDGAGFVDALNAGELWPDFWGAVHCLMGRAAARPTHIDGERQGWLISLLRRLPSSLRQTILAQAFFPVTGDPAKLRKIDGFQRLVIELLAEPWADLRQWEVGIPKITSVDAMETALLIEIARSFASRCGALAAFKAHADDTNPDKRPFSPARGTAPGQVPADRAEALAILEDIPVARTHVDGLVTSEINLHLTQSFHVTARTLKPGIPEGHLMHLALSQMPNGPTFPRIDLGAYPTDVTRPYVATHLDILARALTGTRLPWEPMMNPLKAVRAVAILPRVPADLAVPLESLAKTGSATVKREARALLRTG